MFDIYNMENESWKYNAHKSIYDLRTKILFFNHFLWAHRCHIEFKNYHIFLFQRKKLYLCSCITY